MENKQLKTKPPIGKILVYAGLVIWALIVLFPFYWMLLTSVKSYSSYNAEFIPQLFTLNPTFQNYMDALSRLSGLPIFATTAVADVAKELPEPVIPLQLQEKYFDLPSQKPGNRPLWG